MHAMNVEDGGTECRNCTKFGKDECWTHSPMLCGKCKKRGKTCKCVKKAIYLARITKGAKDEKGTESKEPPRASMESMMTTMQVLTEALSTQQEEAPMAEKKQPTFAAEEELESLFGMTVEVNTKPQEEESIAAYFADETDTDNPPERASPKLPTLPPGGTLNEMKQKYSKMMETLEKQEKQERDAKAEQAAKDHHDEEEGRLAERKAAEEAAEE
jgi:hypothetical protein